MTSGGTTQFWRLYHRLPDDLKEAARGAYRKFAANPSHPSLHLERLESDSRFWSVRVTRDYRAVAQRLHGDVWVWIWIGSHKDFDRRFSPWSRHRQGGLAWRKVRLFNDGIGWNRTARREDARCFAGPAHCPKDESEKR